MVNGDLHGHENLFFINTIGHVDHGKLTAIVTMVRVEVRNV
jgi:translation elongation factor EF-Tu-like GTPase